MRPSTTQLADGLSCRWWVLAALVRQFDQDELVGLGLIAALCPALLRVAARLEWGRDGPWIGPESFGTDLVTEAWIVLSEMAGQTFCYPARALAQRVRRRLAHRRTNFQARARREPPTPEETLDESIGADRFVGGAPLRPSTLDDLAAVLTGDGHGAVGRDELRLVFVTRVLGYSVAELVDRGEGTRGTLQYRRERAEALLCA